MNKPALCPSCDRFIGPADVCPYCESESAKAPVVRRLRLVALVLGGFGLVFLYLMVRQREIPTVRAGDITPMMNYACVQMIGRVEKDAYVRKRDDSVEYVSFFLDDGTGSLQVMASKELARQLADSSRLPRKADRVVVTGTLNAPGEGKPRLRAFRVEPVDPPADPLPEGAGDGR